MIRLGTLSILVSLFVILLPLSAIQESGTTILITELYPNPPGEELEREWVELFNASNTAIDLSNFKLGDEESVGEQEGMFRFPKGAVLPAGDVIVVAQTAVGFRTLFGSEPDYELQESDPAVPNMRRFVLWSSGDFALANDGDELLLMDGRNQLIDSINYGDKTTYFTPAIQLPFEGQSIVRLPANCDTDSAADWQTLNTPTPGTVTIGTLCQTIIPEIVPEKDSPTVEYPPIGTIQGNGAVSPLINETVTLRGVITGVQEDRNARGVTFYTAFVQDGVGMEDGDPQTSDGIALFLGREKPTFNIGDLVTVSGQVTEFFGFTELDDDNLQIIVEAEDVPLPDPILLTIPRSNAAQASYFEPLEGMRVALADTAVVVGPTYSGCGFAVVAQSLGIERILRQKIEDDVGGLLPVLHESDVDCGSFPHLKQGDLVTGIVGPLIYNFDQFKVVQQKGDALQVTAVSTPTIPPPPTLTAIQFSVATFNLENYFDLIDDTGNSAEPKPTAEELSIKQEKLTYAITDTLGCPTIIGVQEVENAALLTTLADLAEEKCGFLYEVTHLESVDGRGIDVALLSNPQRVTILEATLQSTCTSIDTGITDASLDCPGGQSPLFSRPPLRVDLLLDGQEMTLFNNHFKSKRGGEEKTAPRRVAQAEHVASLVDALLTTNSEAKVLVLGDFNDYELSPPLLMLTENGRLYNALSQIPQAERYSFNFAGVSQLIDGILLTPALNATLESIQILHTNADFPDILGSDLTPENIPFRATDHDLLLAVFSLTVDENEDVVRETAVSLPPTTESAPQNEPNTPSNAFVLFGFVGLFAILGIGGVWFWKWRKGEGKRP